MLIRCTPNSDFANILQGFDSLARQSTGLAAGDNPDAQNDTSDSGSLSTRAGFPAIETFRRDDTFILRAEVPGLATSDIKMTVEDGHLILTGEKKQVREEKDSDRYFNEVSYGRFRRSFQLPRGVKADQVQARHENGVLTVTIPVRSLEDTSRTVPIQVLSGPAPESDTSPATKSA
jgi:HSP20 family molecular chaperone IbpA